MPLETQQQVINGRTYSVTQLPAMRALRLLARLGKVVGPALASGMEANVSAAAGLLFERLDEAEMEYLVKQLLQGVVVAEDGKQRDMLVGFDVAYGGAMLVEVFEVLRFALEVQFGPTFAVLLAKLGAQAPAAGVPAPG